MTTGEQPARPGGGHTPWIIALTVTLATFMEVLDTSIANVALPHIAGSLSASVDEATWVLTSYLVANAIVLPLSGWLSSVFGRKRFYMGCVALFTASSVLSGFAPSLGWLVVFRVLQGLSGGGLQPSEQAILADTFPPAQFGMAMSVYGFAVVVAPTLGPTLGGWITDNYSWRWIFFINLPVGLLSLAMTARLIHDPPDFKRQDLSKGLRIDYWGLGLIAVGLGALQVVLDKGQEKDWFGSSLIFWGLIVALAALAGAVYRELTAKEPVVELRLLGERNFAMAVFLMFVLGAVLVGTTVLIPLFLQELMGYTAMLAGLALSPGGLVTMATMPLVGYLSSRVQPRWLIAYGFVMVAISLHRLAGGDLQVNFRFAMLARMIMAAGLGFLFIPINVAAYAFVPPGKNNAASGLINLARNVGSSIGVSMITAFIDRRSQFHQVRLVEHLTPFDPAYRAAVHSTQALAAAGATTPTLSQAELYAQLQRQAGSLAFLDGFRAMMVAAIVAIPLVLLLKRVDPRKAHASPH